MRLADDPVYGPMLKRRRRATRRLRDAFARRGILPEMCGGVEGVDFYLIKTSGTPAFYMTWRGLRQLWRAKFPKEKK